MADRLAFDNPWWALQPGRPVSFRQPPRRLFYAAFAAAFRAAEGGAMVLAGPRRAGKTVMLRQLIAQLIEGGRRPHTLLYAALSTPSYTMASLADLVDAFCTRHGHGDGARLALFLDEAQYAPGWLDQVRDLAARYPRLRIVAAVSAGAPAPAPDLPVFTLPALTFLEFLRLRGSERALFGDAAARPGAHIALREPQLPALNEEFVHYVNYGGFPEGILPKVATAPAPTFVRDGLADRVLHKDLAVLAGISDTHELNRLFTVLARATGGETGIEALARTTGIAKNTVRKYLDYLESAHLIHRLRRVDRDARPFQRAVAFKVFLTSPCLYAALFGPAAPGDAVFPRLVETAVAAQWLGSAAAGDLAYASWRRGGIDLLAFDRDGSAPDLLLEVDWDDAYATARRGPEALGRFAAANCPEARIQVLTRSTARPASLRGRDVRLIPASLYCYLLRREHLAKRTATT
ncbi:MAG: ATP-binding protein [Hyphomicrobiales bacterium]|nr:ATP-binding protein [Hyphomicrobiales bacterium]